VAINEQKLDSYLLGALRLVGALCLY